MLRELLKKAKKPMWLLLLLSLILISCHISQSQAYANYNRQDETIQLRSSRSANNERIYEPAATLQQQKDEIETSERQHHQHWRHQNSMKHMDVEAETEPATVDIERNLSKNQLSNEYSSAEQEESEEMVQDESIASNAEYSNEMDEEENPPLKMTTTTKKAIAERLLPTTTATPTTTTTVPDYIRKPKAEPSRSVSEEGNVADSEPNTSVSDYAEDEEESNNTKRHEAAIVPLAMKYYDDVHDDKPAVSKDEDEDEDDDINENENEEDHIIGSPNKLSKVQRLPQKQQPTTRGRQFHQNNSEEYYDDNDDHESEHDHDHDRAENLNERHLNTKPMTAAQLSTPPTNVPMPRAAIFDSLPVPSNGKAWTTSAPRITTTNALPIMTTSLVMNAAESSASAAVAETTFSPSPSTTLMSATTMTTPTMTTPTAAHLYTQRPVNDKKGKQMPISSTSQAQAQATAATTVTRRKLLPHEQLRNYIEDAYIRMPLAVIVDPSDEALEKTKALWNDALRTNLNTKIILVALNASGIPAAYNFNNTRQFLAGLNSIKEHEGGDAFVGILHVSELVPYDSAVFISTAALSPHTELVQDAAITLLKKRIRLYLIWYGERALSENETQEAVGGILGELAIRSGGEVLHLVGNESSQELEGSTLTLVADAFRGTQEVEVPIDTTLSSLHVKIDKPMRRALLETPNGDVNLKKLVKFKSNVFTFADDDNSLDAYVPLNKVRKVTVFKLKMIPEVTDTEYSVFVRAERKADIFLDNVIKRFESYLVEGRPPYHSSLRNGHLQALTSALSAMPTHDRLKFPKDNEKDYLNEPKNEVETFSTEEIHKNIPNKANTSVPSQTSLSNQRGTNVLQRINTKIEMGLHSQILIAPGIASQLHFEVTNTGCEPTYHNVQVVDERRYLLNLTPQSLFLRPGQMASVSVTVMAPLGTKEGTTDRITFSSSGGGTVTTLALNLKVISSMDTQDTTYPSLSWKFGSRCEHSDLDALHCAEHFWSLDITAQDWQTGILRLQATPSAGLIYTRPYTVASTEPIKATYISSCCEPKVSLVAYDVAGNQRAHTIDVRDLVLTEASVAAIALGVILLILLLILLVASIVWCCRRRQVSLDIPTYRSHSTRSME